MTKSIFDGVDTADPCEVWPVLQNVLDRLLAGEMVIRGQFEDDEVEYQRVDVPRIQQRIRELKAECAAKNGAAPARRAITFG